MSERQETAINRRRQKLTGEERLTSLVTKKVKIKTVKHHFHYEIVRNNRYKKHVYIHRLLKNIQG